jgi:hypothetical protein
LRLEHPVDGEILTAEKLSNSIGNNRAYISQVESRRLKKIKREDIIKIYQVLCNEPDETVAEEMATLDLFSTFMRYDSGKKDSSSIDDSYSEAIVSIDNSLSELRNVLLENYKNLHDDIDRDNLIGCLKLMVDNFRNDYKHAHRIYAVPINYADPEYLGEDYAKSYYDSLDTVCENYELAIREAFNQADIDSFLNNYIEIYNDLMEDINGIDMENAFDDHIDVIVGVEHYSRRIFYYIDRIQNGKKHSKNVSTDELFDLLMTMLKTLLTRLKLNYSLSDTIPTFKSSKNELDSKQLEITNAIMFIIKAVTAKRQPA